MKQNQKDLYSQNQMWIGPDTDFFLKKPSFLSITGLHWSLLLNRITAKEKITQKIASVA